MHQRSREEGSKYPQNIFGMLIEACIVIWNSLLLLQVGSVCDDNEVLEVSGIYNNHQSNLLADVNSHSVAAEVRKRKAIFVQAYRQHPFCCDASQSKLYQPFQTSQTPDFHCLALSLGSSRSAVYALFERLQKLQTE